MTDRPDESPAKVLLIGNTDGLFVDTPCNKNLPYQTCQNVDDAINIISTGKIDIIGVVIPEKLAGFSATLQRLRTASHTVKIVLLAQMFQEPIAVALTEITPSGTKLADDYLIRPLSIKQFNEFIKGSIEQSPVIIRQQSAIDSDTAERIKELERLATEDDLTGLKNRRYIWEFARQIIEYAKERNSQVTLLIFDIDDFKHYNDMYGHLAGDEILKQASALMRKCCRSHDVVGRIGGDEFAVIFWEKPRKDTTRTSTERRSSAEHPREAIFIAERFREQLENTNFNLLGPSGKGVLTISGGLATFPRDAQTVEQLFQKADEALLEAKRSGKNRIYLVGSPGNNSK